MKYEDFVASKSRIVKPSGFTVDDSAINPTLFPFQRDLVRWSLKRGKAALFAATGLGKALASDSSVVTQTGYEPIGRLLPGEYVMSPSGKPTMVVGVFPHGLREGFRVTFSDQSVV